MSQGLISKSHTYWPSTFITWHADRNRAFGDDVYSLKSGRDLFLVLRDQLAYSLDWKHNLSNQFVSSIIW